MRVAKPQRFIPTSITNWLGHLARIGIDRFGHTPQTHLDLAVIGE
jgi:hypothetical protein